MLYQWAVGDRTVPNPTTESAASRRCVSTRCPRSTATTRWRRACAERFRANPHGFLTWTLFPDVAAIGRAAQEQVARFFLSDGQQIEQVDTRFELAAPRP